MKAIHPVTQKVESVRASNNRFKLRVFVFPNGEEFPADTVTTVCSSCEERECVCPKAA
jgi:hypothetical protein